VLSLGPIDDDDVTYFNGAKVGAIGYGHPDHWTAPRSYTVPGRLVKAGRNVIACRVLDGGGGGGIYGSPEQMRLSAAGDARQAIGLAGAWRYRVGCGLGGRSVPQPPRPPAPPIGPGGMYNGMIAPLVPYGIAGAIWYQGESNAGQPITYRQLFPALIRSWRDAWGKELAFVFVQLANFMAPAAEPEEGGWAWLREAQAMALALPKTAMAVTIDIGEANDIHPRNKQDVGKRLAMGALHAQYGRDLVHSGPVYESMAVEGGRIRVRFKHVGAALVARDGRLAQFAVAGADRKFVWAQARIERSAQGRPDDTVVVWNDEVEQPVAVRYAWANNPAGCSLYNREGLPAAPFRSDDWGTAERAEKEQPRKAKE
jgi:sialate O-acetylesterase